MEHGVHSEKELDKDNIIYRYFINALASGAGLVLAIAVTGIIMFAGLLYFSYDGFEGFKLILNWKNW